MPRGRSNARLYPLQSLRFVAAALVLVGHTMMEARQHGGRGFPDALYDRPWSSGVDIFFVISGYVIYYIMRHSSPDWRVGADFMVRRLIRLVPLYWLFTLLMAAVTLLAPAKVRHEVLTLPALLKSMLFIPYQPVAGEVMRPVLGQGWTLNYELFFYAVFAVCLVATRHRYSLATAVLLGFLLVDYLRPISPVIDFYASHWLWLFVAGMAMARWHDELPRHSTAVALALLATAVAVGRWLPIEAHWLDGLPRRAIMSVLAVYAVLFWRNPFAVVARGALPLLGDASYALYLGHPFAVNAIVLAFVRLHWQLGFVFVVVAGVVAVGSTLLLHLWIERPLLRLLTRGYEHSRVGRWAGARRGETMSVPNEDMRSA
jgi:exopolysaccharide production protein ExoZ